MKKLTYISLAFTLLFGLSCNKIKTIKPKVNANFGDVNTTVGVNEIVTIPDGAHNSIKNNFYKYTKLSSTSDLPIHIIAQSEVSDESIIRVKNILKLFLKSIPDTEYGIDKLLISDKIASNKGTIALYTSQFEIEEIKSSLNDVDLNFLHLSESDIVFETDDDYINNDAIDYSYGKIASFIVEQGVKDLYPEYFENIKEATQNAIESNYWFSLSMPQLSKNENTLSLSYFENIIGVYYDFWAHTNTGLAGNNSYRFNSRNALFWGDNLGHKTITDFFPPYIDFKIDFSLPDDTLFSMKLNKNIPYSFKSQHLVNISLIGDNNIDVVGNKYNNIISATTGINKYYVSGNFGEYTISKLGNSTIITDTVSNRGGIDQLDNFEYIQFSDTIIDVL